MIEILALTLPLLAINPRNELTYLPKNMCVELPPEGLADFVVFKENTEENCPEFHVFDL
jgi:hypothetical protein